jgi:hypothetical protein
MSHLRVAARLSVALGLVLIVGGCTTTSGGIPGDLARATDQVASAAQSSLLSAQQLQSERTTAPVTGTTLEDSLTEVTDAQTQVLELDASHGEEADLRDRVLSATTDVAAAIDAVRESVADGLTGLDGAVAQLQDAATAASDLSSEMKGLQ